MIYKRKYDWSTFGKMPVSAQTVGETLERIEREEGKVSKESFFEVSRPADSPTHALFEWDDKKAAERYRLVQSGRYIRDIKVTVITQEQEKKTLNVELKKSDAYEGRGFLNGGKSRTSNVVYNSAVQVLTDAEKRQNALNHAKAELFIFQRKYNSFEELAGVMKEIDKLNPAIGNTWEDIKESIA